MRTVDIGSMPLDRLAELLQGERAERLAQNAALARELLDGRVVWNVNSTATGGGVAEMLQNLLAYAQGAGVDARWLVIEGDTEFFAITKRMHNLLHGSPGDGGPLADEQRPAYERTLARNLPGLLEVVRPGDIVLLHDPQTAGLVAGLTEAGALVVWRCHVGRDVADELTDRAWAFLQPYVEGAAATIFSRQEYVPGWLDAGRLRIIPPSLDPFSAKNRDLTAEQVDAALGRTGLVDRPVDDAHVRFDRRGGSSGTVRPHGDLLVRGEVVPADARLVVQVSRWDRLKDMEGVMRGFVDALDRLPDDVHLALVGPDVRGVTDDPEGAEVLEECTAAWDALPQGARARVHLITLPMDDTDENAHLVNALQRHAAVVVQKSLVEGFGLTVTEPMWKGRPVVGSRVGGIQDQIVDGESGILLHDPEDLGAFGDALVRVLADDDLARRIGEAARERVRDRYLGDRHLLQYGQLFGELLASR